MVSFYDLLMIDVEIFDKFDKLNEFNLFAMTLQFIPHKLLYSTREQNK
jgi:hypothetical protein